jgi:hypothetical protein
MRCLIFNTQEISWTNGEPSDRPAGIRPMRSNSDLSTFHMIAVAFLCIEADDDEMDASCIANELMQYSDMVGRKILIVPFVHLTSNPAKPEAATRYIGLVSETLKKKQLLEATIGFGFHKALVAKWITISHKGSVAFRDSRYFNKDKTI